MKLKAKDLIFIGQINRDGSGITPIDDKYLKFLLESTILNDFELHTLSITNKTYIAFNFNAFVVKIKSEVE